MIIDGMPDERSRTALDEFTGKSKVGGLIDSNWLF